MRERTELLLDDPGPGSCLFPFCCQLKSMTSVDMQKGRVNTGRLALKKESIFYQIFICFCSITLVIVLIIAFCMKIVATVLTVPASREVPENGRKTQDTAAIDRIGLYPHNPWYIW